MAEIKDFSKGKQVKRLLWVLGSGIGAAVLLSLFFLNYYNPSGSYLAKNVLLTPENAFALSFSEPGPKAKTSNRYVFDHVEFSYYDWNEKKHKAVPVKQEDYADFYALVSSEKSLIEANEEIQHLFNQGHSPVLTIRIRDGGNGLERTFSEIAFVEGGDYYRVQLRQHGTGTGWIYFYHPGIYQKIFKFFVPPL